MPFTGQRVTVTFFSVVYLRDDYRGISFVPHNLGWNNYNIFVSKYNYTVFSENCYWRNVVCFFCCPLRYVKKTNCIRKHIHFLSCMLAYVYRRHLTFTLEKPIKFLITLECNYIFVVIEGIFKFYVFLWTSKCKK